MPGEVRTAPDAVLAPPKAAPPTSAVSPVEAEVAPSAVEAEVEAPPELKERLGKTRGVFAAPARP